MDIFHKKILIVEDDFVMAKILQKVLKQEKYLNVHIADSGLGAINESLEFKPDLILMDVILNGSMSGCEAAIKIHQYNKDIKIIFLTAYAEDEMIEYAMDAEATAYLMKPYRIDEILATIKLMFSQQETRIPSTLDNENVYLKHGYIFNLKQHRLFRKNKEIPLGKKLLKLIEILVNNKSVSVSNEQLCNAIWGECKDDRTLRSLVHRIRKLLSDDMVENVSGIGYKMS